MMAAALLVLAASLSVAAAFGGLIWAPAREQALAAKERLDRAEAALADLKYRRRLAQDYASISAQVDKLNAKLASSAADPEFVHDIEGLAQRTQVSVAQFSSRVEEGKAGASATAFEFTLNGSYANIRRFMAELSTLNELVAVERVSLDRSDKSIRADLVLRRIRKPGRKTG
jgi:Tfp pilus assembly protein PilO